MCRYDGVWVNAGITPFWESCIGVSSADYYTVQTRLGHSKWFTMWWFERMLKNMRLPDLTVRSITYGIPRN